MGVKKLRLGSSSYNKEPLSVLDSSFKKQREIASIGRRKEASDVASSSALLWLNRNRIQVIQPQKNMHYGMASFV